MTDVVRAEVRALLVSRAFLFDDGAPAYLAGVDDALLGVFGNLELLQLHRVPPLAGEGPSSPLPRDRDAA